MQGGQPLMESRNTGFKGIPSGMNPMSARPGYAPLSPPRR
jgi:hypothetical protein